MSEHHDTVQALWCSLKIYYQRSKLLLHFLSLWYLFYVQMGMNPQMMGMTSQPQMTGMNMAPGMSQGMMAPMGMQQVWFGNMT